jgi:hypothetical protein
VSAILLAAQIAIGMTLAGGILLVVGLGGTVLWLRHRVRQRIATRMKSGRASRLHRSHFVLRETRFQR